VGLDRFSLFKHRVTRQLLSWSTAGNELKGFPFTSVAGQTLVIEEVGFLLKTIPFLFGLSEEIAWILV
jgi:hypothetical protein